MTADTTRHVTVSVEEELNEGLMKLRVKGTFDLELGGFTAH